MNRLHSISEIVLKDFGYTQREAVTVTISSSYALVSVPEEQKTSLIYTSCDLFYLPTHRQIHHGKNYQPSPVSCSAADCSYLEGYLQTE